MGFFLVSIIIVICFRVLSHEEQYMGLIQRIIYCSLYHAKFPWFQDMVKELEWHILTIKINGDFKSLVETFL